MVALVVAPNMVAVLAYRLLALLAHVFVILSAVGGLEQGFAVPKDKVSK